MSSKHAISLLLVLIVGIALFPRVSMAADWSVSPFRAQVASAPPTTEPIVGDSTLASPYMRKSVGKGVMFSLVIPGAGELYAGQWWRALPWFAVEVAGWAVFADYQNRGQKKTSEFETYAGQWNGSGQSQFVPNHFSERAYMFAEYSVATDTAFAKTVYHGTFSQWLDLSWDDSRADEDRSRHLPAPFTHDIQTSDRQQFYEMIGKYIGQFGFGWMDTHSGTDTSSNPANWSFNWALPAAGITADNPLTVTFDGGSEMFYHYRDMRGRANYLLDKGNAAMEIVLANHILSALDAAFAVRSFNKKSSVASRLGSFKLRYDADVNYVSGNTTRYLRLSVPLD